MKIDKRNYKHWIYLARSGVNILGTLPTRPFRSRKKKIVVLYGHKFNGNIKAFYDYLEDKNLTHIDHYFLVMDPAHAQKLSEQYDRILYMGSFKDMLKVSKAAAIITDHSLHTLVLYAYLTRMKFIDVWHGIPYKGYIPSDFDFLKHYDAVWTNSKHLKKAYVNGLKIPSNKVKVTGYARVDALINLAQPRKKVLEQYSIPTNFKKYILIAPTWKQDDKNRTMFPFGTEAKKFFTELSAVAKRHKAAVILRTHLNSKEDPNIPDFDNILFMPYRDYPVAEDFLYISDVLITDWSSICFDFLPLKRPVIYLDVPSPFKNGYTVDPKYRFGDIVGSLDQLIGSIDANLADPEGFLKRHRAIINTTEKLLYDDTLDGKSADRYLANLEKLI